MSDTFWNNVTTAGPDDCWIWRRALKEGYGQYWNGHKNVKAHRHSVLLDGRDIPAGMVVDHTCRTRSCVNPAHLRVVDRRTNVHENSDALAHKNSLKKHCLRGHPLSGANLYTRKNGKRECLKCCAMRERLRYQERRSTKGFNRFAGDAK